ncbi:hypothetical protein HK104_003719 [Borealophlyctis nickersoniae]|nr:hypothetical protein HK104_003719 [Borealophlyctis nickersoniae]
MTLPYELFRLIVRCAHPIAGRKVRGLNKALREFVTLDDLLWGETGWRWNRSAVLCWMWAARNGHGRIVGTLQQVDPEGTMYFGWAALAIAAEKGHGDIVRMLVGAVGDGAIWEMYRDMLREVARTGRDTYGYVLARVIEIFRSGSSTFQHLLRASSNINGYLGVQKGPNPPQYWKVSVKDDSLATAAYNGHKEVVQLLLQAGANVNISEGRPLIEAVCNGHLEIVQLLLDEGAEEGKGVAFREPELVQLLISAGVNVNENARYNLDHALYSGCSEQIIPLLLDRGMDVHVVVQLLLDKGANVHARNTQALMEAVGHRHLEVARLLLDVGADVHAQNDRALGLAARNGDLAVAKLLLDAGAEVHGQNDTALGLAAKNGHLAVVALLLDAGADVHAAIELDYVVKGRMRRNDLPRNARRSTLTPLGWAAAYGHLAVVKQLLKAGADVHAEDDAALGTVAENGHLEVVRFLLKAGADVNAQNSLALRNARDKGHSEVVELLWNAKGYTDVGKGRP